MSLLFNMLSRFVIALLPRSNHFLISWLQSPSAVILEPKKSMSVFPLFPHLFAMKRWDHHHEVMGLSWHISVSIAIYIYIMIYICVMIHTHTYMFYFSEELWIIHMVMIFLVAILENEGKLFAGIMGLLLKNQFCLLLRMFIFYSLRKECWRNVLLIEFSSLILNQFWT